jgi:hypothetical protein
MVNHKSFGTFTHYCITVQELIKAGFIHSNESHERILKNQRCFTTSFAGSTMMKISFDAKDSGEIEAISAEVKQKIDARKKV